MDKQTQINERNWDENEVDELIASCEEDSRAIFSQIESIALKNQEKVLRAFWKHKVALRHFAQTSGYGYDDVGRDTLCGVYSEVFGAEAALVSPLLASGTHAISTVLFGILRPNMTLLSINGDPYDTLLPIIKGKNIGSLADFDIKYDCVELNSRGKFDFEAICSKLENADVVLIQRSGGYNFREAFSISELEEVILHIKRHKNVPIVVDNCYGEFTDTREPTQVGANVVVGSLIKNPGGGLAPSGGYICGDRGLIDQIAARLVAPGIGFEVGSYAAGYQSFFQGLFFAPHIVEQAAKSAVLFGKAYERLGYKTLPETSRKGNDIIRSIIFGSERHLVEFCRAIQRSSPIDSHVVPESWDMPGYEHQVIMAAGTFIQGASIELSADSPIKPPFVAYLQGALTYEHAKIALKNTLISLKS